MNYLQIDKASISNGTGFRVVLWCAGCTQKCQGCFNPETWDFNAGQPFNEDAKKYLFEKLNKPYIQGITFSGGNPIESQRDITLAFRGSKNQRLINVKKTIEQKQIVLYES